MAEEKEKAAMTQVPRETKLSAVIGGAVGVIASLVTTGGILWALSDSIATMRTNQSNIMARLVELEESQRQAATQVSVLSTSLAEARASVTAGMSSQINFNRDMRELMAQARADREWARAEIVKLQERVR